MSEGIWLKSSEIADIFHVQPRTVQRWIRAMNLSDKLKVNISPNRPLGRWRYHKKVVEMIKAKFMGGHKYMGGYKR